MHCPACATDRSMDVVHDDGGLLLRQCPACRGHWLRAADYWEWRARRTPGEDVEPDLEIEHADPPRLKRCPEDRYVLARFRVGRGSELTVEQCRHCAGVWLDPGELEILSRMGLREHLHDILSEEWQSRIREEERSERSEEQFRRQLGDVDLGRIREIKEWLDGHPKRSELYAYLSVHSLVRDEA